MALVLNRVTGLVLNRVTGLVSPQFHVKFDKRFQTIRGKKMGSAWQVRAGFVAQKEKTISPAPNLKRLRHTPAEVKSNKRKSAETPPSEGGQTLRRPSKKVRFNNPTQIGKVSKTPLKPIPQQEVEAVASLQPANDSITPTETTNTPQQSSVASDSTTSEPPQVTTRSGRSVKKDFPAH